MDTVADPGWFQIAIESGAGFLVVVALFVVALGMMLRSQSKDRCEMTKALTEAARLGARAQLQTSRAIHRQSHLSQRVSQTLTALISEVKVQPLRYAIEKEKALNGGWKPHELEEYQRRIDSSDTALASASSWPSDDYRLSEDPDETIEDRIGRLKIEAETASSKERRVELEHRIAMLRAELTTS